jgi:hypothetical protein
MSSFVTSTLIISTGCALVAMAMAGTTLAYKAKYGLGRKGISIVTILIACVTLLLNVYNVVYGGGR